MYNMRSSRVTTACGLETRSFIHFNRRIFTTDLRPCEHDNRVKALRGRRRAIFTTSFRLTDHTTTTTSALSVNIGGRMDGRTTVRMAIGPMIIERGRHSVRTGAKYDLRATGYTHRRRRGRVVTVGTLMSLLRTHYHGYRPAQQLHPANSCRERSYCGRSAIDRLNHLGSVGN